MQLRVTFTDAPKDGGEVAWKEVFCNFSADDISPSASSLQFILDVTAKLHYYVFSKLPKPPSFTPVSSLRGLYEAMYSQSSCFLFLFLLAFCGTLGRIKDPVGALPPWSSFTFAPHWIR